MPSISRASAAIWNTLRTPMVIAGALAVMAAIGRWGGAAHPGPLFVAGVALLSGLVLAFGTLTWWLYLSPLPDQDAAAMRPATAARQVLGMLSLISGALFLIGSFWDEVWHRTYGSFGDDFLWPPHMLIYPHVEAATLPGMIGWGVAAALAFGWAGARLGAWLGALDRPAELARANVWAGRVAAGVLLAAVLFTTFFILTARSPIAA